MRRALWLILAFLYAPVALGQSVEPIHISDYLLHQPRAREAAASFQQLKARGWAPAANKQQEALDVGDKQIFRVRDIAAEETQPSPVYIQVEFTLQVIEEDFNLWVETAELENLHVRAQDLEAIRAALADATPVNSVNPNEGIIGNDEAVFGAPPDVDGSGKSDVLLVDVRDGWVEGGFIAGFVDPLDVLCVEPVVQGCTPGNMRDILYLDTYPGLFANGQYRSVQGIIGTAAHEYQHLIHLNYDTDEITFINEGLSEYAEIVNGYGGRPITYLTSRETYNIHLFRWSFGLDEEVLQDYERAGLFTTYLGDRIGVQKAGSLTRTETTRADDAYQEVLAASGAGLTLDRIILDFHTANFLNVPVMLGTVLTGYETESRQNVRAVSSATHDGSVSLLTAATKDTVESGAALYFVWNNVQDFHLNLDVTTPELSQEAALRARMRVRAILEPAAGGRTIQDIEPQPEARTFDGAFRRIVLVVTHAMPDENAPIPFLYSASWSGQQTAREETFVYDDGVVPSSTGTDGSLELEAYSLDAAAMQANRFVVPEGSTLSRVAVAPFYESQFDATIPSGTARDFRLRVWTDAAGKPGQEIFAADFTDPRLNTSATLNFYTIDLTPYSAQLSNLPGTVYVGLSNAGTDVNYLLMGVTKGTADENSLLYLPSASDWVAFPDVRASGEAILVNRVIPIRATFLIPTTGTPSEEGGSPVLALGLLQNFPNPTSGRTQIGFTLPRPTQVRIEIFDMVGRRVAVIADGSYQAGIHSATYDTGSLNSGMYFYRMHAGDQVLTRQLVVAH